MVPIDVVMTISTTTDLERELNKPDKLIVLEFMAPWSEPCKVMKEPYRRIARARKDRVNFYTLNVDKFKDLAEEAGVEALPTYVLLKNDDVMDMVVGVRRHELENAIKNNI